MATSVTYELDTFLNGKEVFAAGHSAGRELTSDWSVTSFIMLVCETELSRIQPL